MPELLLRDATVADLPALVQLYERSGLDAPGSSDLTSVQAAWERLMRHPGARVRVADLQGQPVATLTLFVLPLLAHNGAPEAVIEDVAVDPSCQRQGIGRAIMDDAMRLARQAGCYKLALSSNGKRMGAHAFYAQLGYRAHGLSFHVDAKETAA